MPAPGWSWSLSPMPYPGCPIQLQACVSQRRCLQAEMEQAWLELPLGYCCIASKPRLATHFPKWQSCLIAELILVRVMDVDAHHLLPSACTAAREGKGKLFPGCLTLTLHQRGETPLLPSLLWGCSLWSSPDIPQ